MQLKIEINMGTILLEDKETIENTPKIMLLIFKSSFSIKKRNTTIFKRDEMESLATYPGYSWFQNALRKSSSSCSTDGHVF